MFHYGYLNYNRSKNECKFSYCISVQGQSKAVHGCRVEIIAVFHAAFTDISFDSIDHVVFHMLHDTDVISYAVTLPVEENDVTGSGS